MEGSGTGIKHRAPLIRLFGFLMLLSAMGFVAYGYQVWSDLERETRERLAFIGQMLNRTTNEVFEHHQSVLRVLGERLLELNAGEQPERGRQLVDNMLTLNPSLAGFGLARPDGQLVLVSGVEPGKPLPNLRQQPQSSDSFRRVLETRQMVSGRTYYLPLLRSWVLPLRVPVVGSQGDVQLVMTLGIDIASSHTTWNLVDLPEGAEIRILRSDGYWQMVSPLAESQRSAVYGQVIERDWMQRVEQAKVTGEGSQGYFDYQDRLYASAYLPDRDVYTLVSFPRENVVAAYLERMSMPLLLFVAVLLVGSAFFLIAYRQQRRYEAQLIQQAHFDSLTRLPNRLLVMDRVRLGLQHARREDHKLVLVFIDLDHFKRINDSFGHLVGDQLLVQCAARLQGLLRAGDTVARLGGDEFLILLPGVDDMEAVETVIHKLRDSFAEPFSVDRRMVFSTCSIGLAVYPEDGDSPEALMRAADTALYKAKEAGRNTHCFYSEAMNLEARRRMNLESELQTALQKNELSLVYQPQVNLESGRWTGFEALLRWHNEKLGPVSPVEFIAVAEESGLIRQIGDFVLQTACRDLARIKAVSPEPLVMAINLSAVQLHEADFADQVSACLEDNQLQARDLELEITESMLLDNADQLQRLNARGLSIAVDDFGTGFCSLGYLQRFPVSTLKVDRSFVMGIEDNPREARLVRAIVNLGDSLQLGVVAEGIETEAQLAYLRDAGCRSGQGYFFSRPQPLEPLLRMLESVTG